MPTPQATVSPVPAAAPPPTSPIDDVAAFLQSEPGAAPIDPSLAKALTDSGLVSTNAGETPPEGPAEEAPPPQLPVEPTFDPNGPTIPNAVLWALQDVDFGTIEVTETEKQLYLKALLNEAAVQWDIETAVDIKITCRSREEFETYLVAWALKDAQKNGQIADLADWGTKLRHYMAAIQLVSIGDHPFDAYKADQTKTQEALIGELNDFVQKKLLPMHAPIAALCINALRVFTIKETICANKILDRSFWKPADNG